VHIMLWYGSGDPVQVSRSQCVIGPQPEDKNDMSCSIVFDHDPKQYHRACRSRGGCSFMFS
jgi:hypothetical protein